MACIIRVPSRCRHATNSSSLVPEVGVHHRLGDAGVVRDLVHRGGVEAAPGEDLDRRVEHLLLAHGAGQSFGGVPDTLRAYLLVRKVTHQ